MLSPDSPATPWILGAALVLLLAGLAYNARRKDRKEYRRFKRLRSTKRRQAFYKRWLLQSFAIFGGSAVVTLLLAGQFAPLLLDEVTAWSWVAGARDGVGAGWAIAIGVLIAIVAVVGILLARPKDGDEADIPTIGDVQALLPRNRAELRFGALLSINAGIVEELLFRLALPALIFGVTGSAVAALVASLLVFGLLHVYQGVPGVIGSMLVGAVLMAIYIGTGSILAAIIAHVLFDLRSLVLIPVVVFRVHRNTSPLGAPVRRARPARDRVEGDSGEQDEPRHHEAE